MTLAAAYTAQSGTYPEFLHVHDAGDTVRISVRGPAVPNDDGVLTEGPTVSMTMPRDKYVKLLKQALEQMPDV